MEHYTFIAYWRGKYENLFTQEYHILWGQRPRGIWYSWVNKFSYFLNPHAMHVLLYRMKPRKHIHVTYCWQTYFKSIGGLSQAFKNHIHNNIVTVALQVMRSRVPLTFSCQRTITLAGRPARLPKGWNMIFISWNMICVLCNHVLWLLPIIQSN